MSCAHMLMDVAADGARDGGGDHPEPVAGEALGGGEGSSVDGAIARAIAGLTSRSLSIS